MAAPSGLSPELMRLLGMRARQQASLGPQTEATDVKVKTVALPPKATATTSATSSAKIRDKAALDETQAKTERFATLLRDGATGQSSTVADLNRRREQSKLLKR